MAKEPKTEESVEKTVDDKSGGDSGGDAGEGKGKLFTESEKDSLISHAVEQALRKRESKFQEDLEAEKAKLEQERLAEQGKWQEIAESKEAELNRLKAEQKERDFIERCRESANEAGYNGLADIVLKFRSVKTPEDFKSALDLLNKANEERNQKAIEDALDTGTRTSTKQASLSTGKFDPKTASHADKLKYIEEHGQDAYQKAAYAAAGIT